MQQLFLAKTFKQNLFKKDHKNQITEEPSINAAPSTSPDKAKMTRKSSFSVHKHNIRNVL